MPTTSAFALTLTAVLSVNCPWHALSTHVKMEVFAMMKARELSASALVTILVLTVSTFSEPTVHSMQTTADSEVAATVVSALPSKMANSNVAAQTPTPDPSVIPSLDAILTLA